MSVLGIDFDLPVSTVQIKCALHDRTAQGIQTFSYRWQREDLRFGDIVQGSKVGEKRYVPSFLGTKRIGEDQGDEDLQMTPLSSIFLIWRSTSGRSVSGVLRNFKATGKLVPVLILNFVRSVRPTSELVLANTSR